MTGVQSQSGHCSFQGSNLVLILKEVDLTPKSVWTRWCEEKCALRRRPEQASSPKSQVVWVASSVVIEEEHFPALILLSSFVVITYFSQLFPSNHPLTAWLLFLGIYFLSSCDYVSLWWSNPPNLWFLLGNTKLPRINQKWWIHKTRGTQPGKRETLLGETIWN